jgi:DNA-binding SARP family transcriptional activator
VGIGAGVSGQQLSFGLLGPLRVERGGLPLPLPRSGVLRGLLGVLLLAEGQPVPPDRLISLVWTNQREVRRQSVQVGVCRLRDWLASLTDDGTAGGTAAPVVGHGAGGYCLTVDPAAIDLSRFRALVAEAAGQPDPAVRFRLLTDALELSRGPVLADLTGLPGTDPLLAAADDAVRAATLALADAALTDTALAARQSAAVVGRLAALADARPLDEPVYARLIDTLAASRRPAEALARYEQLRARLGEELGVSPSAEVQRAYLDVLDRDRVLAASPAAGPVAEATPPVERPRPCLLPPDLADFTGRETAGAALAQLLTAPPGTAIPVAVLSGQAGVGKTALAVHLAHGLRDRFPDGQLYVDLHATGPAPADPREVLGRFLRALGVPPADVPGCLEERAELYRALLADRRVLVVLDDAAAHRQVRPLLPGGSGCAVLVTGRRALTGLGTDLIRLDVWDRPSALALLGRVTGPDRLAAEPDAANALVDLCGRLPLAVRIAAGRLAHRPHRPLDWLVERLADERLRLDELTFGDLAVRPRLAVGYRRLDLAGQRLLRRLALLDGLEFGPWVAAALLDVPSEQGEEVLERLVEEQLVEVAGRHTTGMLRYRLPDLVRAYARERADAEEAARDADAARTRVLAGWLAQSPASPVGPGARAIASTLVGAPDRPGFGSRHPLRTPKHLPALPIRKGDCRPAV